VPGGPQPTPSALRVCRPLGDQSPPKGGRRSIATAWRTCQSRSSASRSRAASTESPSNPPSAATERRRRAGLPSVAARTTGRPAGSPRAPSVATVSSRTSGSSVDAASATTGSTASRAALSARATKAATTTRVSWSRQAMRLGITSSPTPLARCAARIFTSGAGSARPVMTAASVSRPWRASAPSAVTRILGSGSRKASSTSPNPMADRSPPASRTASRCDRSLGTGTVSSL